MSDPDDRPPVGMTGARFGGTGRRRRGRTGRADVAGAPTEPFPMIDFDGEPSSADVQPPDHLPPAPRPPGAMAPGPMPPAVPQPAGPPRHRTAPPPDPAVVPEPRPGRADRPTAAESGIAESLRDMGLDELGAAGGEAEGPWRSGVAVRPYVRTGGRTRANVELAVETLVSTRGVPVQRTATMGADHQAVLQICADARSVAEVAVGLRVPLGVARVLIGDLAESGALTVHASAGAAGPDVTLMQRVIDGLRRL